MKSRIFLLQSLLPLFLVFSEVLPVPINRSVRSDAHSNKELDLTKGEEGSKFEGDIILTDKDEEVMIQSKHRFVTTAVNIQSISENQRTENRQTELEFNTNEEATKLQKQDSKAPSSSTPVKRQAMEDVTSGDAVVVEPTQTTNQTTNQTAVIDNSHHIWPNMRIPYKFESGMHSMYRGIFTRAMNMWSDASCLNFTDATANDTDYLYLRVNPNGRCESYVGRQGGVQYIYIGSECMEVGNAAHELGHALGLWHEHSRPDRDQYIEILYDNIIEGSARENFDTLIAEKANLVPDVGYDLESIMHYSAFAFARGKPSIRIREDSGLPELKCANRLTMGQRIKLSHKDQLRVNKLYQCKAELARLEASPPMCQTSIITPTPSVTPSPSTPSATIAPSATPKPQRLKSGDVIILDLTGNDSDKAVTCETSDCLPKIRNNCFFLSKHDCREDETKFTIISPGRKKGRKIKSGDNVTLRSYHRQSTWLGCQLEEDCRISQCETNALNSVNTSSQSNCSEHQFVITSPDRDIGQIITTKHTVQLKNDTTNSFLNCEGKVCKLTTPGGCDSSSSNNSCVTEPTTFSVYKFSS